MMIDFIIMMHRQESDEAIALVREMEMRRTSYPENRKEVYKFWLGFIEKLFLVLGTVVIIPRIFGQLKYPVLSLVWVSAVIFVLLAIMSIISHRLWYLEKESKQIKEN